MSHQDVLHGSNLDLLAAVRDNFAHAVVTDPPYGLGFMGKDWDSALPDPRTWAECLRVLRPGGHLVAFGAPRLVHRLTCQIEDAGFEIRDQLLWVFAQGFPKSLDVSKAIDAAAGAVEAARWSGWGTALKPAYESIVLARKPLDGTVAQTVQRWGTGAINVDGCRVETDDNLNGGTYSGGKRAPMPGDTRSSASAGRYGEDGRLSPDQFKQPAGRWPANLILDEDAGAMLDAQSGTTKSTQGKPRKGAPGEGYGMTHTGAEYSDSGGASRFFARVDFGEVDRFMYCPKASRSEREAGLDHLSPRVVDPSREEDAAARDNPRTGAGRSGEARCNHHATVKPIDLMRWLVRLVTPPGGMVLEPFAGSGTTPAACALEDVDCLAMELDADYVEIARARVAHAVQQREEELAAKIESSRQMDLFAMEACS
jgi:site-specific DNA-methyltransferase (adenine-specific)